MMSRPSALVVSVLALAVSIAGTTIVVTGAEASSAPGNSRPDVAVVNAEQRADKVVRAVTSASLNQIELARVVDLPSEPACMNRVPCDWDYFGAPSGLSSASSVQNDVQMIAPNATFTLEDLSARLTAPAPGTSVYVDLMVRDGKFNEGVLQCEITTGVTCRNSGTSLSSHGNSLLSVSVNEVNNTGVLPAEDVLFTYRLTTD
jgi:hypothetical protein